MDETFGEWDLETKLFFGLCPECDHIVQSRQPCIVACPNCTRLFRLIDDNQLGGLVSMRREQ